MHNNTYDSYLIHQATEILVRAPWRIVLDAVDRGDCEADVDNIKPLIDSLRCAVYNKECDLPKNANTIGVLVSCLLRVVGGDRDRLRKLLIKCTNWGGK